MTGDTPQAEPASSRTPTAHLGVAVVNDLLTAIVSGEVPPGDTLPSQERLAKQFGVSRTVIRESVKRIEDKGLITLESGRGTTVQPPASWNILHPAVLSLMLENDDSLRVLDDIAVIRGALEGAKSTSTSSS